MLTDDQRARVTAALDSKLRACAVCGVNLWQLVDVAELPIPGHPHGTPGLPRGAFPYVTVPTVVVACSSCGNTLLFIAALAGLGPEAAALAPPVKGPRP